MSSPLAVMLPTNNEPGIFKNSALTLSSSFSSASVIGNKNVGGLIGATNTGDYGSILNSYATGNVTGGTNVGGLVGASSGTTITNSYSFGSVTTTSWHAGGLVGGAGAYSIFTNSSSAGSVKGDSYVGCLLYTSPSPRDLSTSRMPSSA